MVRRLALVLVVCLVFLAIPAPAQVILTDAQWSALTTLVDELEATQLQLTTQLGEAVKAYSEQESLLAKERQSYAILETYSKKLEKQIDDLSLGLWMTLGISSLLLALALIF